MINLTALTNEIKEQMAGQTSHEFDHLKRVNNLALSFAEKLPEHTQVNRNKLTVIALLHDLDDHKFNSHTKVKNQTNTKTVLQHYPISETEQNDLLREINTIGFSKRLTGLCPNSLEAKLVSDADMCEAAGILGCLRIKTYYETKHLPFFDPDAHITASDIKTDYEHCVNGVVHSSGIVHICKKILQLHKYMLTEPGKKEMLKRQEETIKFLHAFFLQENHPKWNQYLTNYLTATNHPYINKK